MISVARVMTGASASLVAALAMAAPPPLEHFARMPQIRDVSISPDGRHIAFISGIKDRSVVMTFDRKAGGEFRQVTASEPGKYDISWCKWANDERLLCGLSGNVRNKKYAEPAYSRLIALNADGRDLRGLNSGADKADPFVTTTSLQNLDMNQGAHIDAAQKPFNLDPRLLGTSRAMYSAERQDEVVDVTLGENETVLLQLDDDGDSYRSIFSLDVYSGQRVLRLREVPPMQNFATDGKGNLRIGWGRTDQLTTHYFARLEGDRDWKPLAKSEAFSSSKVLEPIGVLGNAAFAVGDHDGREALWALDLTDKLQPELIFSHRSVDIGEPVLTPDKRLLGVRYDTDKPSIYYAGEKVRAMMTRINNQFSSTFNSIVDSTPDDKVFVLRSQSDVDAGTYYLFDSENDKLQKLGVAYPELKADQLGKMQSIVYKASDGTEIPGYLTVPQGGPSQNLPMIVMPHDGPVARDTWEFSFLRSFLVSRGYAVLQMNYRGSSGYGSKWRLDAHQNWGGVTYSDIADAARWAVSTGVADKNRVCIAGWGFGGYAALLGAVRNSDVFRCSVSIAGIADLEMQRSQATIFSAAEAAYRREQIGSDPGKLKAHSPLQHADEIKIPVLLVHGDRDYQVQIDHSKEMAAALKRAKKPHKAVYIKSATHELDRESDRVTLLQEIEAFLKQHLDSGSAST